MHSRYLGRIPFAYALEAEAEAFVAVRNGSEGHVLGFESEPVITLGRRGREDVDVTAARDELRAAGFELVRLERGGQATVHNPGQLVLFPVFSVKEWGARSWVCVLAKATRASLADWGVAAQWDESRPGVYTTRGKIASLGVRIRQGISTHGVAINVNNSLEDFGRIRACGVEGAAMDRLADHVRDGSAPSLEAVFATWLEHFQRQLTR
jgi:lipoate-protein ligase B